MNNRAVEMLGIFNENRRTKLELGERRLRLKSRSERK